DERGGRDRPDPVGTLGHVEARTDADPDLLRVGSHDTEERSVIGVEARVFRFGNVESRWDTFVRALRPAGSRVERHQHGDRGNYSLHLSLPPPAKSISAF